MPENELQRLAALLRLRLLDSTPDESLNALTRCMARGVRAPVAMISLIDADRQWFMCRIGLEARETPRSISFCGHAICQDEPLVVPDAANDPRFADNPLVTGPSSVHAYLGAPLVVRGAAIGTLCAIDTTARPWSDADVAFAKDLAAGVTAILDNRDLRVELGESFSSLARLCGPRAA